MNIQSEIRDYILSHDFVMLPGIGAFVAEYSRPYFGKDGEIVPSERTIRFNPLLRNDSDVDILQVFREKMNISDAEVQEQYFAFLDTVNEQIATYNRYYWEDFGILLTEGPDAVFQFLPFKPSVYDEPPVTQSIQESPLVIDPEIIQDSGTARAVDPELSEAGAGFEEKTFPAETREGIISGTELYPEHISDDLPEEEPDPEDEPQEGGNKALKYLVFALPLALLTAALVYMVFFKPSLRENVKEKAGPVLNEPEFGGEEVTVDTLYMDPAPQVTEPLPEEHVVRVGIYKRSKDADKIVAFLAEKGYEAKIRPHGPLFKVYLVADTEEQAIRYIKEVERLIDDTPIYERKKNNG